MARRVTMQRIVPPLQTDFPEHRLTDAVTDARHLAVEGMESEEMRPRACGCEQVREIAVAIRRTDDVGTLGGGVHRRRYRSGLSRPRRGLPPRPALRRGGG